MSDLHITISGTKRLLTKDKYCDKNIVVTAEVDEGALDAAYDEGIEVGRQAEYDAFWDIYQDYGNRQDYTNAFSFGGVYLASDSSNLDRGWCDKIYNPKYPIIMNGVWTATGTFQYAAITNTKVDIIAYGAAKFNSTFNGCTKLKTIPLLYVEETATFSAAFANCTDLENITFDGTIGSTIEFPNSSLLTTASVQSIIDHLKDLTGAATQNLKLHATVVGNMTAEQKAAISAKNWTLVY